MTRRLHGCRLCGGKTRHEDWRCSSCRIGDDGLTVDERLRTLLAQVPPTSWRGRGA